jgi:AcrR family transcriptional regulator
LAAAVRAVEELGYTRATVAHITRRARVSRRTFYELFANREECLLAVMEDALATVQGEVAAAGLSGLSWVERVRGGLWVVLGFFDREPALARVCVVQSLRGGPGVLELRARTLARLAAVVDEGRLQGPRGGGCTSLTAEGLVGAAFVIVHTRLLRGERAALSGLLGELMGMIVLPYLGPAAARREQSRPLPARPVRHRAARHAQVGVDPLEGLAMRMTYRTLRVLEGIAEHPGASNRLAADCAGITDPGQISRLLRRLEHLGLLANTTGQERAKGEPNAWSLTARGQQVAQSIRARTHEERQAA